MMAALRLLFFLVFVGGHLPVQLALPFDSTGYDMEELRQLLLPFNVALHATITATSTCGKAKPTNICYLDTFTGVHNNTECDVCDASDRAKSHPADYAIDGKDTSWVSELGPQEVNVTIDLRQHFYISSVILKMGRSLPPRNWRLEKSLDGVTFNPWQYFAGCPEECRKDFQASANAIPEDVNDVLCVTKQLGLKDINGEIHVQLLDGRPGSRNFDESEDLQTWSDARYVRLNFLKPETFGENIELAPLHDNNFKQLIYYSLRDVTVLAYCICHGYSDSCTWNARKNMFVCNCTRNTCGDECTRCCDGFPQFAWKPFSTTDSSFSCERCNCFGHSNECIYNATVDQNNLSFDLSGRRRGGGMCLNCKGNTTGVNCDLCMPGFYRSPFSPKTESCEDCRNCSTVLVQEIKAVEYRVAYMSDIMLDLFQNPDVLLHRRDEHLEKSLDLANHFSETLTTDFRNSAYYSRKAKMDSLHPSVAKVASKMWNYAYAATSVDKYSNAVTNAASHVKAINADKFSLEAIQTLESTKGLLNFINELSQNRITLLEGDALKEAGDLLLEIKTDETLQDADISTKMELIVANRLYKSVTSICQGKKLLGEECKKQEMKLLNLKPRIQRIFELADYLLRRALITKQVTLRNQIIFTRIKGHVKNFWQLVYHMNQSLILAFESRDLLGIANDHWWQSFTKLHTINGNINGMESRIHELVSLIDERNDLKKKLSDQTTASQQELSSLQVSKQRVRKYHQDKKEIETLLNEAEAVAKSIEVFQFSAYKTKARSQWLLNRAKGLTTDRSHSVKWSIVEKPVLKFVPTKNTTGESEVDVTLPKWSPSLKSKTTIDPTHDGKGASAAEESEESDDWDYEDSLTEVTTEEPKTKALWDFFWGDAPAKQDKGASAAEESEESDDWDYEDSLTEVTTEEPKTKALWDLFWDDAPAKQDKGASAAEESEESDDWDYEDSLTEVTTEEPKTKALWDFLWDDAPAKQDKGASAAEESEESDDWDYEDSLTEVTTEEPKTKALWDFLWDDAPAKQDLRFHDRIDHLNHITLKQNYSLQLHQQRLKQFAEKVNEYQLQIRKRSKTIADVHQTMDSALKATELRHKRFLPEYKGNGERWTSLEDRFHKLDEKLNNHTSMWQELINNPCSTQHDSPLIAICVDKKLEDYHNSVEKCKTLTQSVELKQQHYQFGHLAKKISSLRQKIETAKKMARRFTGPVEFSSPGFMSPTLPNEVVGLSAISQIELRGNSTYEDGWIFSSSRRTTTSFFVYVRLVNSQLEICACLDQEIKCVQLSSSPLRGKWFHLSLLRIGGHLTISLVVNGSERITESLVWKNPSNYLAYIGQPVYVGGLPESFKSRNLSPHNDFDGVLTLAINGYEVSLISANEQSGLQQFKLQWTEGMYVPETLVSFDGKGFHKLPIAYSSKPIMLDFKFRTFEDGVLLAHIQSSKKAVYVTVWLNSSKVHVRYNHYHISGSLSTVGNNYNDGKWHLVKIQQKSNAWMLSVDQSDKDSAIVSPGLLVGSMLKSSLLIGGLESITKQLLPSILQGNLKNLTGCLANISIGGKMQNMNNYESSKRTTIGKCIMPTSKCSCFSSHLISLNHLDKSIHVATISFKTNETKSSILWYSMSRPGFINVYQNKGKMNIVVEDRHVSGRYFDRNSSLTVNDGQWHSLVLVLGNRSSLIVDSLRMDFKDRLKEAFYDSQHKLVFGGELAYAHKTCFKDLAVNDRILDLSGKGMSCSQ